MIEIYWGDPMSLVISPDGDVQRFSTIEQAQYWLRKKWPVADAARLHALGRLEAAMDCLGPVSEARDAFLNAVQTAGFLPQGRPALPFAA